MNIKHLLTIATLATVAATAQAADATHVYTLDTPADALGGPALTGLGGTFGSSGYGRVGYSFGVNQGLALGSALNVGVYSIDFSFALEQVSGYRRLLDFQNLGSDTGLYVLSGALHFYGATAGTTTVFSADTLARVTVTRDAAGVFTAYVDGVQQLQFNDSGNLAVFSGPSNVAHFFRDDNAVGNEASAGFADYIRTYDVALGASEVANLPAVPEPGTWALMLAGVALLAPVLRRR